MTDLDLILDAALEAGELALRLKTRDLGVERKADGTPVTKADLSVDAFLRERLLGARPDCAWLSEESVDDPSRLSQRRLFIVDPIDGTRAFIRGRPWWAVCIAIVEDGRPVAGVVHAPECSETYAAAAGAGARLNGDIIRQSGRKSLEGARMLADAALISRPIWPNPWPPMELASRNAVALRVALVAAGAFDATLALSGKGEWDLAAACLVAEEAGAVATDHTGAGFAFNTPAARAPSLVCAGPDLHALILRQTHSIDLPA